jgi:hypothetical protein
VHRSVNKKRYVKNINEFISIMSRFDYQFTDAVNRLQSVSVKAIEKRSVEGDATENRTWLRAVTHEFWQSCAC